MYNFKHDLFYKDSKQPQATSLRAIKHGYVICQKMADNSVLHVSYLELKYLENEQGEIFLLTFTNSLLQYSCFVLVINNFNSFFMN